MPGRRYGELWSEMPLETGSNRENGAGPSGQGAVQGKHCRAGLHPPPPPPLNFPRHQDSATFDGVQ